MKKRLTIREVEERIDFYERWIRSDISEMRIWSFAVSEYNALKIKYCQMKGKHPIVSHGRTEHIT